MIFEIIFRKLQLQLHKEMVFKLKDVMISKRMVSWFSWVRRREQQEQKGMQRDRGLRGIGSPIALYSIDCATLRARRLKKWKIAQRTPFGAPNLGSAEGGHPDLFRFVSISPFSSDLFRFALHVFGNTPICSDLFRFAPFYSDLFSEQIRQTPFCRPLLQIPEP